MSDFKAKMHQIRFRLGLRPRPRWGSLQRSPGPLVAFTRPTSNGREGRGEKGEGGRRGKWRRGKWRGGKGRREGGAPFNFLPPGATDLVTPLPPHIYKFILVLLCVLTSAIYLFIMISYTKYIEQTNKKNIKNKYK